jgi:hypothetical protein
MYPHRIRLRGPWECEPAGLPPRRVNMPARWADAGLAGYRGSARFIRKFGYPGKADPEFEHIWLVCDGCTGVREVRLNDHLLAPSSTESFALDVTSLMSARNQLDVIIDGQSDAAGLWGDVAMEMRKDAFLDDVRVRRTPTGLTLTGRVVGAAPRPLELYTLLDRRHIDYRTIEPSAAGTAFSIAVSDLSSPAEIVRVELIHISEVWYVVELTNSQWQSA